MNNITIDINDIHNIEDLYQLASDKAAFRLTNENKSLVIMDDEHYRELVTTIKVLQGLDDVKKGKTTPADTFFSDFKLKYGA
jgi:hypothetical protein